MTGADERPLPDRVYDLLRPDTARNPAFLRKRLGDEGLDQAVASIVDQGRAKWVGGRLLKVTGADLTEPAQLLLAELPDDGSRIGNRQLRSRPALSELSADDYLGAKRDLVHHGLALAGPGPGGTLARVIHEDEEERDATDVRTSGDRAVACGRGLVGLEQELYESFREWERDNVTVGDFAFATALVSATPLGYRRGRGEWTRPDVMSVTVWNTELLPGASVEVATYELKKADDADKISNVYEAAAHGRWAHRSSLVLELPRDEAPDERVVKEAARFGLGVYRMRLEQDRAQVAEIREPDRREPETADLDELLQYFFARLSRREQIAYKAAVRA